MKKNALLCLLLTSYILGYSQSLNWTPIADYPHPSFWPASFMIGDDLYVSGGLVSSSPVVGTNDLQEYDPTTNTWTSKSSLPAGTNLYCASSFTINGMGYILNGQIVNGSYSTGLWQYNPTSDTWTAMAPFPGTPNYTASSFSIGPYGFLGLGYLPYTDSFYCYNSQTNIWYPIQTFPGAARQGAVAFVINGIAYVGLGGTQNGGIFVNHSDFYKYDTISNTWSAVASFPDTPRIDAQSFVMNGKGYVVAGMGSVGTDLTSVVWEYDPLANSWTQLNDFPISFRSGMGNGNNNYAVVGLGQNLAQNYTSQLWKTSSKANSVLEVSQDVQKIWFYNNIVHIQFLEPLQDDAIFSLHDVSGREIIKIVLQKGESKYEISTSTLNDGLYLYSMFSSTDMLLKSNGKVIVTH
jgi:N-acetylneuraminic acid mutarotase